MDIITLYFTGRVLHKPIRKLRLCLAGAAGALSATAGTVLFSPSSAAENALFVLSGVILSAVMMLAAFGRNGSFSGLIRDSIVLWGAGALLGGVMTFILSLGEPVFVSKSRTASFSAVFALCFLMTYVITRLFSSAGHKQTERVTLDAAGEHTEFTALVDSGNIACEPISGLPVVIVSHTVCGRLNALLREGSGKLRIRAVLLRTIGGERLCMGFIPDRLTAGERETEAVVVIDNENSSFGGCGGILPASLARGTHIKRRKTNE